MNLLLIFSQVLIFLMVSRSMAYNYSLLGQNLSEKIITVFPGSREADTSAFYDKSFCQRYCLQNIKYSSSRKKSDSHQGRVIHYPLLSQLLGGNVFDITVISRKYIQESRMIIFRQPRCSYGVMLSFRGNFSMFREAAQNIYWIFLNQQHAHFYLCRR